MLPLLGLGKLALTLGELGYGIYNAFQSSDQLEEFYRQMKRQAQEGLPQAEEARMLSAGSQGIAQQAAAMQRRGAAALASRGVSDSSAADAMISSVGATQAELYSKLQESIRSLDQQMKLQGLNALGQLSGEISGKAERSQMMAGNLLGSALGNLLDQKLWSELGLMEQQPDEMERMFMLIQKYFPTQSPKNQTDTLDNLMKSYLFPGTEAPQTSFPILNQWFLNQLFNRNLPLPE